MSDKDFWASSYTPVRFPKADFQLFPGHRTAFWGSCFAQELSLYYENLNLNKSDSPFGIIYNPLSMANSLNMVLENKLEYSPFYHSGLWRHDGFHSSRCFKGAEDQSAQASDHFSQVISQGHDDLLNTDILVITLGTAYVYQKIAQGNIVNNCHKQKNNLFNRFPYTLYEKQDTTLLDVLKRLKNQKNNLNVILTVSPVRHLRDDARENSYSKALLRCLCEDLIHTEDFIHYFPSYEIVIDELRDYRWFAQDLCHPSPIAVEYIMKKFFEWCGSQKLLEFIEIKKKERKHNSHRPHIIDSH